ncbi:MAG: hypothetical protein ACR2M1_08040 [Gemmatimonadaceae bacterium]
MKTGKAFWAGVAGGIAMVVLMWMGRTFMGMHMNLSMMLGTMFLPMGAGAWIMGFIMHLIISGLIALIYAWGFENVTHKAGVWVGLGFSIIHAIGAGIFMGMVPAIHPRIPEMMPAPGFFLSSMGMMGVIALFILHFVYGGIVGAMYGPVEHPAGRFAERPATM